jgi:hypothetical protein
VPAEYSGARAQRSAQDAPLYDDRHCRQAAFYFPQSFYLCGQRDNFSSHCDTPCTSVSAPRLRCAGR